MLAKTSENGSILPTPASIRENTANNSVEPDDIKQCPADLPAFVRYGCLGCLKIHFGNCLHGNEVGDEFCLRDRKLNTRATAECERKGCISAEHIENGILVCTHNETKCKCVDRLGNSYGNLQRTRTVREIIDADKANESLRVVSLLKARRHPSGAIITEEMRA
jgi:hypothetical protein